MSSSSTSWYLLSLSCKYFRNVLRNNSVCRALLEKHALFSQEYVDTRKTSQQYAHALRDLAKRRLAVAHLRPFVAAVVAVADQHIYVNRTLLYMTERYLRILRLSGTVRSEAVVDVRALLDRAEPESKGTVNYTFAPVHYADGYVSCLYSHKFDGIRNNWLVVFNPATGWTMSHHLASYNELFVRNDRNYLVYGTFSGRGEDGERLWALRRYSFHNRCWCKDTIHLSSIASTNIGNNLVFQILDGYFYAVASQTHEEHESRGIYPVSYYCSYRFPLQNPCYHQTATKASRWRRSNNEEGTADDRWQSLWLEKDEGTGKTMAIESRREWWQGRGSSRRTYYKQELVFPQLCGCTGCRETRKSDSSSSPNSGSPNSGGPSSSSHDSSYEESDTDLDSSSDASSTSASTGTTIVVGKELPVAGDGEHGSGSGGGGQGVSSSLDGVAHAADGGTMQGWSEQQEQEARQEEQQKFLQKPYRPPSHVHPGDDSLEITLFTLSECFARVYVSSCSTFVDLVNKPAFPDEQRLLLRAGSRRPRPPSGYAKSSSSSRDSNRENGGNKSNDDTGTDCHKSAQDEKAADLSQLDDGGDDDPLYPAWEINRLYETREVVTWPPSDTDEPRYQELNWVLNPSSYKGDISSTWDHYTLVYATGGSSGNKSGASSSSNSNAQGQGPKERQKRTLVLISFDRTLFLPGLKGWHSGQPVGNDAWAMMGMGSTDGNRESAHPENSTSPAGDAGWVSSTSPWYMDRKSGFDFTF